MLKTCIKCRIEKELKDFDKKEKSLDGHRNQCKRCLYDRRKERFNCLTSEKKEEYKIRKKEIESIGKIKQI